MPGWVPDLIVKVGPLRRAARFAGWTYLAAALAIIVLLIVPVILTLFGYRTYVIYGGSMGSALRNGSIAITRRVEAKSVNVGDVVAIRRSARSLPVLHRIVDVETSDGTRRFVTQGDANKEPDSEPASLQGTGDRVVFSIPYLGYLVHFARGGTGRALLLIIPSTLLAGIILWQTWKDLVPGPYVSEEPQC
ncbi:MAG TPA: signal peptidase I [Dehalococcoidia bacterium]|nr:signal peptidase I [Dehalococcoidia bacterium]